MLIIAVFLCGAAVMMYEIIGSRLVAPYIGVSTYVWTSLIGVILASLSFGYYVGGRLADRNPSRTQLATIILISAFAILLTVLTKDIFSSVIAIMPLGMETKSVLLSLVLFAPASFFLGIVSPYAVKLATNDLERNGRIVGNLYAISTLGSIVGTFFAGFYMIPFVGSTKSLFVLVLILSVTSALLFGKNISNTRNLSLLFLCVLISATLWIFASVVKFPNRIADTDTEYSRIWILSGVDKNTGRPTRYLMNDAYGVQAGIFTDDTDDLLFEYAKYYQLVGHFVPKVKTSLLIGGSAYTYPRDFLKNFPEATMDVVEIDPGTTALARKYFGLKDDPRLSIFHEDGRMFLNRNTNKYDVIFIDAFNSGTSVPFHLTTTEAMQNTYDSLGNNGALFINIISSFVGDKGRLFRAEYATIKNIFPVVYAFQVNKKLNGFERQNIIVVALKSDNSVPLASSNKEISARLSNLWKKPVSDDVSILTDDFAPTDYYMRKSI